MKYAALTKKKRHSDDPEITNYVLSSKYCWKENKRVKRYDNVVLNITLHLLKILTYNLVRPLSFVSAMYL